MPDYSIPTDEQLAVKARELIAADLSVYDSNHSLAERLGTNPIKLKMAFKKQYGESVFEFSRRERIGYAKKLLRETNYTLQTIAEAIGYTEGNNFQLAFKMMVGMTPGEWRRGNGKW